MQKCKDKEHMRSTITVVKNHTEMPIKNDASGGVEQIHILI